MTEAELRDIAARGRNDIAIFAVALIDAEREKVRVLREALQHARNQIRHPDQMIDEALATTEPKP